MSEIKEIDVVIVGGGAAGLMCAIRAGEMGRSVVVLEQNDRVGKKILISGGGRCNFTNLNATFENYISKNKHFCKSALKQFRANDFLELVERHKVAYHHKTPGQLFCDKSSKEIVQLLQKEYAELDVEVLTQRKVEYVDYQDGKFLVETTWGDFRCESLVVASGALSVPKLGVSDVGYHIAKQFGHEITERFAGLVPFMMSDKHSWKELSGVSLAAEVRCGSQVFRDSILLTHRGISGPGILQISSYWRPGKRVLIDLYPGGDLLNDLKDFKAYFAQKEAKVFFEKLPKRFIDEFFLRYKLSNKQMGQISSKELQQIAKSFQEWEIVPSGTEGYRTAEVTVGGVDTDGISSKTMESKLQSGLFFIGEVVDVTGQLGGFNFQWAWSSGYAAGTVA